MNVAKYLMQKGVDMKSIDNRGNTALHFACMHGCKYSVHFLLEHEKSIMNVLNNEERSAIGISRAIEDTDTAILLLENGADSQSLVNSFMQNHYKRAASRRAREIIHLQPLMKKHFKIPLIQKLITEFTLGRINERALQNLFKIIYPASVA